MKKQQNVNNWFTIVELQRNIWGIAEFGHSEKVISYLFIGNSQALLFDTGMGIGDIKKAVKKITNLPILVINSHTHFDHIGGDHQFDKIILFNHRLSQANAKKGFSQKYMFGAYKKKSFIKKPPRLFSFAKYNIKPFSWTQMVKNNDKLLIDPFTFKIIHTPGHSPDSICLYEKNTGILLSGDTLYPGNIYLHLKESNTADYIKSINKLMRLTLSKIFPAHNGFYFDITHLHKIHKTLLNIKQINSNKISIVDKTSLLLKK
ncbi:MAG: MBL fold metallo-hydrolase [Patescibacteria group bacterium]